MRRRLMTVAVIEDNKIISNQISWHITKTFNRELQVLTAKTHKDAVEIIEQGLADIYIVDFGLPDGDGEDLIKMIRAKSHIPPIIPQTTIQDMEYQLKIFKGYERIKYITKDVLFKELTTCLKWAKRDIEHSQGQRLLLPGRQLMDSLDIYEICYIEKIADVQGLNVVYYDFEARANGFKEIKYMGLDKFLEEYNKLNIFLRCHNSYIISKKMVEQVLVLDNELLMLCRGEKNMEIRIPIGPTFKKSVLSQLKGLY